MLTQNDLLKVNCHQRQVISSKPLPRCSSIFIYQSRHSNYGTYSRSGRRCLIARSRKVSKPRDWIWKYTYRLEIWQATRQQCCRDASNISQRLGNGEPISLTFKISRILLVWHLTFDVFPARCLPCHGPLTRYVKLWVAHAPGVPGTFSRHRLQTKPPVSDPGIHHGTCVTHVPRCMSGSLTRGGWENVPGIPCARATRNCTYLARDPWLLPLLLPTHTHTHLHTDTAVAIVRYSYPRSPPEYLD